MRRGRLRVRMRKGAVDFFLSFFPVQCLCGSGGCGHAAAAGGLLPKRVEESESVFGMNFSFFLFNDEKSGACSKLAAVCVGPPPWCSRLVGYFSVFCEKKI